jgi:endonuclease/exonuclease/phosphatase (EEP) superfamily protein YafD
MSATARRYAIAAIWVYFTILFFWLLAYLFTGDRFAVIAAVNMLAVYLFSPLPIVLLAAPFLHRREVWSGALLGILAFAVIWGGLFTPVLPHASAGGPELKVLTFNALGWASSPDEQIETLRRIDADIVLLQEYNLTLANAANEELSNEYAYQYPLPVDGVTGLGILSKIPLEPSNETLPLEWLGEPQIYNFTWEGRQVTLVNFHMIPVGLARPSTNRDQNRYREAQAAALSNLADRVGTVIVAGDANTTPLNDAYRILASGMVDSWEAAGFGLGHTFPGSAVPGSARPRIAGIPVPKWLARIDYVFVSRDWNVIEAHLAPFDGVSDHRGVVVRLTLQPDSD